MLGTRKLCLRLRTRIWGDTLGRLEAQIKKSLNLISDTKRSPESARVSAQISSSMANIDSYMKDFIDSTRFRYSRALEYLQQALDMSSILGQAVDIAQS